MKAKQHKVKGVVRDFILEKRGRQVVKFWSMGGYGLNVRDLHEVNGVLLDTQYDGRLYAPISVIREHGIPHTFKDEQQLILKLEHWRTVS